MEFNPVVVDPEVKGASYQPSLDVPKQYNHIVLEWDLEKHVAVITFNRPEVHNALSVTLMEETIDALGIIERNDEVSCAIIRSAGGTWCTGGDFNDFTGKDLLSQRWYFEIPPRVLIAMTDATVPIIIRAIKGNCCTFGRVLSASVRKSFFSARECFENYFTRLERPGKEG